MRIKENTSVRGHVSRHRASLLVVSPFARDALTKEVVPQLERGAMDPAAVGAIHLSTMGALQHAFRAKNEVYTRLVTYKSIDQSDGQFLDDLLQALEEWALATADTVGSLQPMTELGSLSEFGDFDLGTMRL